MQLKTERANEIAAYLAREDLHDKTIRLVQTFRKWGVSAPEGVAIMLRSVGMLITIQTHDKKEPQFLLDIIKLLVSQVEGATIEAQDENDSREAGKTTDEEQTCH